MERLKTFLLKACAFTLAFIFLAAIVALSPAVADDEDISYRVDPRTNLCFAVLKGKDGPADMDEVPCTDNVLKLAGDR